MRRAGRDPASPKQRGEIINIHQELVRKFAADPIDIWGPYVREELYNLSQDPRETRNLAESDADRCKALDEILKAYKRLCLAHPPGAQIKRPQAPTMSEQEIRDLEALGYL